MATINLTSGANINQAVAPLSGGGNIINLAAGTYRGFTLSKDGVAGNPNIIRAAPGAAVLEFDGDKLTTFRTSGHVTTGVIGLALASHWIIEGLRFPSASSDGSNSDRCSNIEIRFCEIGRTAGNAGGNHALRPIGINKLWVHHNLFEDRATVAPFIDYAVQMHASDDALLEHNVIRGRFHEGISAKRNCKRPTIRHNCFFNGSFSILLGQNYDDNRANSLGEATTVRGGASNTRNHTCIDPLAEYNFFSSYSDETGTYQPSGHVWIGNSRRSVVRYNFMQRHRSGATTHGGPRSQANIETGVAEPLHQDADVYGNTAIHGQGGINEQATAALITVQSRGVPRDNLRVWNNTGFQASVPALYGRPHQNPKPWHVVSDLSETRITFINNNLCHYSASWQFESGAAPITVVEEGNNNYFNAGSRGAAGDVAVDPQFRGSTAAPGHISILPTVWNIKGYIEQFAGGDRWMYQAGSPLLTAGRPAPATDIQGRPTVWQGGAVAIGSHQALDAILGGAGERLQETWSDSSVFAMSAPLWRQDIVTPWVEGRGLVVRVCTGLRRLVVGIGSDPLDPGSFASDVWIHKTAFLQLKRNKVAIELRAGTEGAEEDGSGAAWRTRAVFDWTDPAEHVVGFWVRYEIAAAPHRVAAATAWAWQGVQLADATA
jgi:hypothetical protein